MKRRYVPVLVGACTVLALGMFQGCATPPPVVTKQVEEPVKQDPYDLFSGVRLAGDGPFRVQAEPTAIDKAKLVVEVLKIRITEMENPDGGSEKEISLRVRFTRGDQTKIVWMEEGESATVLGTNPKLAKGGESYVERRQDYFPFAVLEVR